MGKGLFGRLQEELDGQEKAAGLSMADVLMLPDPLRKLVNWMIREEDVGLEQVTAYLGQGEDEARTMLADLIEKGFVRELHFHDQPRYRVRLAMRRKRDIPLNIWQALDDKVE